MPRIASVASTTTCFMFGERQVPQIHLSAQGHQLQVLGVCWGYSPEWFQRDVAVMLTCGVPGK